MTAQRVPTDITTNDDHELIQWAKNEMSKQADLSFLNSSSRKRHWLNTIESEELLQVVEQERSLSPPEKTIRLDTSNTRKHKAFILL